MGNSARPLDHQIQSVTQHSVDDGAEESLGPAGQDTHRQLDPHAPPTESGSTCDLYPLSVPGDHTVQPSVETGNIPGPSEPWLEDHLNNDDTGGLFFSDQSSSWGSDAVTDEDDDSDEEPEDNRMQTVADEMLKILTLNGVGCTSAEHQAELNTHLDEVTEEECQGLSATYNSQVSFLQGPLAKTTVVGLDNLTFPKPIDVARGNFVPSPVIKQLMEGKVDDDDVPQNVCLHQEYRPPTVPITEYDTDGVIVFADDLTAIQSKIKVTFTKMTTMNIASDLHVTKRVRKRGPNGATVTSQAQIQHLPHLYLGSLPDLHDCPVYRVFPFIEAEARSNWLTDRDTQRYIDQVWLRACREHSSDGARQYFPPSWRVAEQKAAAKAKEHLSTIRSSGRIIRSFPLHPTDFAAIEDAAESIIRESTTGELQDFRGSFIVVNAKNTKLNLRHQGLWSAMHMFDTTIDRIFDRTRITLISDLALEVVPATQDTDAETSAGDLSGTMSNDPAMYLWKTCCLRQMLQSIRTNIFSGHRGRVEEFTNAFLRDAVSMTIVPPAKSAAKQAGLHYCQFYIVEKAFEDANSIRPFDKSEIVNLAIAEALYRQGGFAQNRPNLERNFAHCKKRLKTAFESYRGSSTGARFEIRTSSPLRGMMKDGAYIQDHPMSVDLEFLWVLPTTVWLDFKAGNFQKITSLIDVVVLSNPASGVTNSAAQLLFILLTYLQNLSNCNPRRKSLLWKDRTEIYGEEKYGIGLQTTIEESGFGWMRPVIDWERFCLRPNAENNIIGVNDIVGVCYKAEDALRLLYDERAQMEVCYTALRRAKAESPYELAVLKTLAAFVLRTYRRDFWAIVCPAYKSEVREAFRDPSVTDEIQFCWDALEEVMVKPPYLVNGNRVGKDYGPEYVFQWVMTEKLGPRRDFMDGNGRERRQKPFRATLANIWHLTKQKPGLAERWENALRKECQDYMWMFPAPDGNGTMVSCDRGQRRFVSIKMRSKVNAPKDMWDFAKTDKRYGRPPAWPQTLSMSPYDLEMYLKTFHD